jgi:hypothetical protein
MSLLDNFDPESDAAQDIGLDAKTVGIMDDLASGAAFDRTFETTIGDIKTTMEGSIATIQSLPTTINGVSGDIMSKVQGLDTMVSGAIDKVAPFLDHVTSQFDNLAGNLDLFASSQGLKNALAGAESCDSMHDFFGSITQEGPELMNQLGSLTSDLTSGIDQFKALGDSLQTSISDTQSQLVSSLQSEISTTTDSAKLTQLNGLLTQVQSSFGTAVGDVRAGVIEQASSLLSGANLSSLTTKATQMLGIDSSISSGADAISGIAGNIDLGGSGLTDLLTGEQNKLTDAVSQLTTLGDAQAVQSLFGSNKCVQTLLGYVGTDSFLGKLG